LTQHQVTHVRLGDYLDTCVDQALETLQHRNPGLQWDREQLIRLAVGYGLNRLFRQHTRLGLNLSGAYKHLYSDAVERSLIVENLSRGGIGFRTVEEDTIRVNEILLVEFSLPDELSTLVQHHVLIKHVNGQSVGAAFAEPELSGKLDRFLAQGEQVD
jgi:hypothetical protein